MYAPRDIMQALAVIKDTCLDNNCAECPFHNDKSQTINTLSSCLIRASNPGTWNLEEHTPSWKAFKEV